MRTERRPELAVSKKSVDGGLVCKLQEFSQVNRSGLIK